MGTVRNYILAKYFDQYFKNTHVLTTKNRNILPQDPQPLDQLKVTEAVTIDYRTISNLGNQKRTHYKESTKSSSTGKFAVKILNSFPFNLIIGEGGLIYSISSARQAAKLIRKNNITHIYSSFRPYSDHFTAYLIKKRHPSIFWIADFRDIHIDSIKDNVYWTSFQKWCNKKLISKANIVTAVSEGTIEHLVDYNKNIYLLRNGIQNSLHKKTETIEFDKLTITYTGSMYGQERDPENLLRAVQNLIQEKKIDSKKIQIIYAGKDGAQWENYIQKYGLENCFQNKGMLSLQEAINLQHSSHINLLLSFSSPEVTGGLTGKIYEYFAAKQPILLIIKGSRDQEFENIFDELNAGLVAYDSKDHIPAIKKYILDHYQYWLVNGIVKSEINLQKLKSDYSWSGVIPKFMDKIQIHKSIQHH